MISSIFSYSMCIKTGLNVIRMADRTHNALWNIVNDDVSTKKSKTRVASS